MDEYVSLPEDHSESYHTFMYRNFFSHIDIDPANVHILDGNAPNLAAECVAYEQAITQAGGIDLFLGGIGPDGHIAFNEPGSSLRSRTHVATLAEDTVRANSRFFDNDISKVPRQALTVGVQTVMDAREVVLIVTGANKAVALQKTVEGSVSQMWTASALQMHEDAMIVANEDATGEMLVKTVKYFKSVEQIEAEEEERRRSRKSKSKDKHQAAVLTPPQTPTKIEQERHLHSAAKVLKIDTSKSRRDNTVSGDDNGDDEEDLTPDSMSSRLIDSAISMEQKSRTMDDFVFDRMSSRVATFAA